VVGQRRGHPSCLYQRLGVLGLDKNLQVAIDGDASAVKAYLVAVDKELALKDAKVQDLLKEGSHDKPERGGCLLARPQEACLTTVVPLGEAEDSPRRKVC